MKGQVVGSWGGSGRVLKQHIVEFIAGTGVITDGVTDATDTTSPFSWTVPQGVTQLFVDMCGAGGGGSTGADPTGAISVGGGGGGGSGVCLINMPVSVIPGATLEIGIGAAGTGGSGYSTAGNAGGNSYVKGIRTRILMTTAETDSFDLTALGGGGGTNSATASAAAATNGGGGGTSGATTTNVAGGTGGAAGTSTAIENLVSYYGVLSWCRGAGGAGAAASGASAGQTGGIITRTGAIIQALNRTNLISSSSPGNTTGSLSRGGGGTGGTSWFGSAGIGAAGGSNGINALGYGAGGGGAGGGANTGGNGGPGYVRFTYWS